MVAILEIVLRQVFKFVVGLVLILATLTPLVECFDHWDKNVAPANDTELRVTAWFVCAGLFIATAKLVRFVVPVSLTKRRPSEVLKPVATVQLTTNLCPAPTASPPLLALRI